MAKAQPKPKCVGLKCDAKNLFDDSLKKAVLGQMTKTVKQLVDKQKKHGLTFDPKCKDGWLLTATVEHLKADDPKAPKQLEVKVTVSGVRVGATASGFNAKGSAKATGVNAKKLEQEATGLVDAVLADLMAKQVIPQLLKS